VTSIGYQAFQQTMLVETEVSLPSSFSENQRLWYLYNCAAYTEIALPDGVTLIGGYAFYKCTSLASITLPGGVTSIGDSAFSGCTSLALVYVPTDCFVGPGAFTGTIEGFVYGSAPLPPLPPPPPAPPMICLNTCGTAGDAVCQDGGWGAFGSMCEFGTDCVDCGPRLLLDPPPSPPLFPPPPPPNPHPPPPGLPPQPGSPSEPTASIGQAEAAAASTETTQDAAPLGLVIGLPVGFCLLAAAAVCMWRKLRKRHQAAQPPPGSSSTAPPQIEVAVSAPGAKA